MRSVVVAETHDSSKTIFGFWVYLMTDCVLFASLFATYAVLQGNTFGGPDGRELFSMPFVLVETIILLASSFTAGMAVVSMQAQRKTHVLGWLALTCALGIAFLSMEISEFAQLVAEGNSWQRSGFLSAFFTLVATHGLHIATGLLWLLVVFVQTLRSGLTAATVQRLTLFSLFWHFLDVVWIFIFTIVYLMGAA